MRKIFIILFLMLSIFTVINAHPFKSDKELYDFYAEIDKKIFAEKNKPIVRKKFPRKLTKEEEKYLKSIATVGPANLWRWLARWFSILGNKVLTHGRANNEIEWHADKDVNFIEGFGAINPENFIKFLISFHISS